VFHAFRRQRGLAFDMDEGQGRRPALGFFGGPGFNFDIAVDGNIGILLQSQYCPAYTPLRFRVYRSGEVTQAQAWVSPD
jgi:hypothetical protein